MKQLTLHHSEGMGEFTETEIEEQWREEKMRLPDSEKR